MKAEYINPFVTATISVIETMARQQVQPGKPTLKRDNKTWGEITGLIGMAGELASGTMVVSFDKPTILRVVEALLFERYESITPDVVDAVGELTNMICGAAKRELAECGHRFDMSTPVVIQGKDVIISQLANAPVITIPFDIAKGHRFVVEANLTDRAAAKVE